MSQVAFLGPQNAPKSFTAGASPQTPLGSLQRSLRPLRWVQGVYFQGPTCKGREREGRGAKMVLETLSPPLNTANEVHEEQL